MAPMMIKIRLIRHFHDEKSKFVFEKSKFVCGGGISQTPFQRDEDTHFRTPTPFTTSTPPPFHPNTLHPTPRSHHGLGFMGWVGWKALGSFIALIRALSALKYGSKKPNYAHASKILYKFQCKCDLFFRVFALHDV